ncbi:MAG: ribonuclease R [Clostridiales Family XIII bacterium]|jgi:ribonuclease R|nr:ribonuclease R [Clostridiales Family XIII bacterium]
MKKSKKKSKISLSANLRKIGNGAGFVRDDSDGTEVFIPASKMNGAMDGDFVEVEIIRPVRGGNFEYKERRRGQVVRVIKRAYSHAAGEFRDHGRYGLVTSKLGKETVRIVIANRNKGEAQDGDTVEAEIIDYADYTDSMQGRITEIISRGGEPGGDILAVIRQHGLSIEFSEAVEAEAASVSGGICENDLVGRRDLRDETIFTIDGADSKDFDDAVSVKRLEGGGYKLGVHIADVSHYVVEGSELDKEALNRGTSIYLLDQVAPMLPVSLSNGICSLNEGVDRLTLTIDMMVNASGEVEAHELYESVIRSKARLVYGDVSDLLENAALSGTEKCAALRSELLLMGELAEVLYERRKARGSIEFDLDEASIQLNSEGIPVEISVADRRAANKLIEEFMLLANETVARRCHGKRLPFIYRIHQKPDPDRLTEFRKFLEGMGIKMKGGVERPRPSDFNAMLEKIKGRPEENVINTVMLRTMKKACYGVECDGHFGLALKYYCHFTSPIRRYPDLMIHRIIKENLRGSITMKRRDALAKKADYAADRSSETEKSALDLEREVEKMKKAEYMRYHIGEEYDAVISGVTSFGFFIGLSNTVEGLVHIDTLMDDYYVYDAAKYRLEGESSGKKWTLGDAVKVKAESVDVSRREVNFTIVYEKAVKAYAAKPKKGRRYRRRAGR